MTVNEIMETFEDINHMYNNCTKKDTLQRMCEELEEDTKKVLLSTIEREIDNYIQYRGNFVTSGYSFCAEMKEIIHILSKEVLYGSEYFNITGEDRSDK